MESCTPTAIPTRAGFLGSVPIGLSAEHGIFFRMPGKDAVWQDHTAEVHPRRKVKRFAEVCAQVDLSWKPQVLAIMEDFTDRTPGSFVEHKQINVCWHYRYMFRSRFHRNNDWRDESSNDSDSDGDSNRYSHATPIRAVVHRSATKDSRAGMRTRSTLWNRPRT